MCLWITFREEKGKKRKRKESISRNVPSQVWKSLNKGTSDHMRPQAAAAACPLMVSLETSLSEQWVTSLLRGAGGEFYQSPWASRCRLFHWLIPTYSYFCPLLTWTESSFRWPLGAQPPNTDRQKQDWLFADKASSTALWKGCSQEELSSITSSWAFTLTAKMDLGLWRILWQVHTCLCLTVNKCAVALNVFKRCDHMWLNVTASGEKGILVLNQN